MVLLATWDRWEFMLVSTAQLLAMSLTLLGHTAEVHGKLVTSSLLDVNVIRDCTGVHPMAIFVAGVLAYPSRWKWKLLGILAGIPALIAINQGRLVSLCYVGRSYPESLETVHLIVWQSLIVVFGVVLFAVWAVIAGRR